MRLMVSSVRRVDFDSTEARRGIHSVATFQNLGFLTDYLPELHNYQLHSNKQSWIQLANAA